MRYFFFYRNIIIKQNLFELLLKLLFLNIFSTNGIEWIPHFMRYGSIHNLKELILCHYFIVEYCVWHIYYLKHDHFIIISFKVFPFNLYISWFFWLLLLWSLIYYFEYLFFQYLMILLYYFINAHFYFLINLLKLCIFFFIFHVLLFSYFIAEIIFSIDFLK